MLSIELKRKPIQFARYFLQKIKINIKYSILLGSYAISDKAIQEYSGISDLSSRKVLESFVKRFSIKEIDDKTISVGQNGYDEYIEGTDKKISEIVRLIEFGTAGIPPVPRISRVLNKMSLEVETMYENWSSGNI